MIELPFYITKVYSEVRLVKRNSVFVPICSKVSCIVGDPNSSVFVLAASY